MLVVVQGEVKTFACLWFCFLQKVLHLAKMGDISDISFHKHSTTKQNELQQCVSAQNRGFLNDAIVYTSY